MVVNQNLVYIALRMKDGEAVRVVSRMTDAADDVCVRVGEVISGTRAAISTFVITKSELKPEEFRVWRQKQNLTIESCASRYGISADDVRKYENKQSFK